MWRRNIPFFCPLKLWRKCKVTLCITSYLPYVSCATLWRDKCPWPFPCDLMNMKLCTRIHPARPWFIYFSFPRQMSVSSLNTIYLRSTDDNDSWLLAQSIDRNATTGRDRIVLLIKVKGPFRHLVRSTWSCSVILEPPLSSIQSAELPTHQLTRQSPMRTFT